ncbi:MAG: right-handed parallel beta-helix repeat-containing protein [Polyangiaceae bacterium]
MSQAHRVRVAHRLSVLLAAFSFAACEPLSEETPAREPAVPNDPALPIDAGEPVTEGGASARDASPLAPTNDTTIEDAGARSPPAPDAGGPPPYDAGAAAPLDGRYVSPANTGWMPTGALLSPYTGPSNVIAAGTVIDGKDVSTCLTISAPNVTIKRSRIRCSGDYALYQGGGAQGLLVEDVEITSASTAGAGEQSSVDRAMLFTDGATVRRAYVHGTRRGVALGDNTTIEASYIGDNVNNTAAHSSAVAAWGGTKNVVLRNNNLSTAPNTMASSAASFYPESGPNVGFTIVGNLFDTDGGYAMYVGYTPSAGESPNTSFQITDNWFGVRYHPECGSYGPVTNANDGLQAGGGTWQRNRWYAPGTPKDGTLLPL